VTNQFVASGDKDSEWLRVVYPSTKRANLPGQREEVECVYASLRLGDFQTKEPKSSPAQGKVLVKEPKGKDSHIIDKQCDKSCPIGMPDVDNRRARHVDAIKLVLSLGDIYKAPPPEKAWSQRGAGIGIEWPARGSGECVNSISKPFGVEFVDRGNQT
jgi:hypothetical protein